MREMEREVEPEAERSMKQGLLESLRRLTDAELVARVEALAKRERGATALLVAHLAELDTRDVYLRAGYSSLFTYCRDALGLSEHEAYNRIEVARAARRFPVILELLAAGSVNLTTVRLLGPHLTPENHRGVLESARGMKRTEVEEIVARLAPFPEAPSFVRRLPAPRPAAPPPEYRGPAGQVVPLGSAPAALPALASSVPAAAPAGSAGSPPVDSPLAGPPPAGAPFASAPPVAVIPATVVPAPASPAPVPPAPYFYRPPSGEVTPLAPDRYKLQCTIDGSTLAKLRLAKDMLRHAIPSGDDAAILDRAFTALLADLARSKFAAVENPQPSRGATPGSRHIPSEVKRAVWVRDLGRCAFVGSDGRRCNERAFVEFHHVRPYAVGGEATAENIQLRCRRHNDYEARAYFDRGRVDDGEGVLREPVAHYGPDRTLQSAGSPVLPSLGSLVARRVAGEVVSKRVRTTALAGSSACARRASRAPVRAAVTHRAAATEPSTSASPHPPVGSTPAASDRAGRAARASAGRPAARESRPPPRHG
jgi:hypothetical protein